MRNTSRNLQVAEAVYSGCCWHYLRKGFALLQLMLLSEEEEETGTEEVAQDRVAV